MCPAHQERNAEHCSIGGMTTVYRFIEQRSSVCREIPSPRAVTDAPQASRTGTRLASQHGGTPSELFCQTRLLKWSVMLRHLGAPRRIHCRSPSRPAAFHSRIEVPPQKTLCAMCETNGQRPTANGQRPKIRRVAPGHGPMLRRELMESRRHGSGPDCGTFVG